jgi:pyroglutamyl-peptidase
MKTVLVTGFEPFGGATVNPSGRIAEALDGTVVAGARVRGLVLPCVFATAAPLLLAETVRLKPAAVLCLGLAAGRAAVSVERIAINVADARIPDNAGAKPVDEPVVPSGPAAHWSRLPVKAVVAAIRARGVAAEVSQTAGTFLCNHVFYALMHALEGTEVPGGFLHVPALPGQDGVPDGCPRMDEASIRTAVEAALETVLDGKPELRVSAGAES